ncbi:MAG: hypothetical protein ACO1TE_16590 [Prosthecobacter sp.]
MKTTTILLLAAVACLRPSKAEEDDGGFHSIAEYRAADPAMVAHIPYENIDDLFDTRDAALQLASAKSVRLVRKPSDTVHLFYTDLEGKASLSERLGKQIPTVELAEADYRPMLKLAADFDNYGDSTMCGFDPGVAVIIGESEPAFVLVCCFKCTDIHIVRRPTAEHPLPRVSKVGMSPELERTIFSLAQQAYPKDQALQAFKLPDRKRSKTKILKRTGPLKDPFGKTHSEEKKTTHKPAIEHHA